METPAEIRERWAYLRDLLIEQLGRFETGTLTMSTGGDDISSSAIARLKRNIQDFDELIARSDARHGPPPE
jgi:hypothetical protein